MRAIAIIALLLCPLYMSGGYRVSYEYEPIVNISNEYDEILTAIAEVESNFRNVHNREEGAVGILQVRQICLTDVNRRYGTSYSLSEMVNPLKAAHVFILYMELYNAKTYEEMARIWNGGPRGMRKQSTIPYWGKVKSHIKQ